MENEEIIEIVRLMKQLSEMRGKRLTLAEILAELDKQGSF